MAILSGFRHFDVPSIGGASSDAEPAQPKPSTQELLDALRRFLYDLRTDVEIEHEFITAIKTGLVQRLQEQNQVRVRLSVSRSWPRQLPVAMASNIYRVLEEALNNSRLHGRADDISVRLQPAGEGRLEIVVTDNGSAANQFGESRFRGVGTLGLRDRVNALGGELEVESAGASGTRVRIRFPIA